MLFAQLPETATPTTIVGAFILVCTALLTLVGWTMRHVFMTTMPQQSVAFTDTIHTIAASAEAKLLAVLKDSEGSRTALLAEQKNQREFHERNLAEAMRAAREESAVDRRQYAEQFSILNTAIVGIVSAIQQQGQTIAATVNEHTTNAMGQYRHDLNDMINRAVLEDEVYRAKKLNPADLKGASPGGTQEKPR